MLKEILVLGTLLIVTVSAVKYDLKYIRDLLGSTKKPRFDVKLREDDYYTQVFSEEYDDDIAINREEYEETFRKEAEEDKETPNNEDNAENKIIYPTLPYFSDIPVTIHSKKGEPVFKTLDKFGTIVINKTAFIFPGFNKNVTNYPEDFLNSTTKGLLKVGYEEVYAFDFNKILEPNETNENVIKLLLVGQFLGLIINDKNKAKDLILIGDDIGNVITSTISIFSKTKIDYIFGLNERVFSEPLFFNFYLRADMGKLVQTINTKNFNHTYAHRNFVIKGDPKVEAYKLFEEDISANGTKYWSTQCVNYDSLNRMKCDRFFKVSLWNKIPADPQNIGNFYFTLTKKRSSSQKRCA